MKIATAVKVAKSVGLEVVDYGHSAERTPRRLYGINRGPRTAWLYVSQGSEEIGAVHVSCNGQWISYRSVKRALATLLFRCYSGVRDGAHYAITSVYNPSNLEPTHYVLPPGGDEFTSTDPEFCALVTAAYDDSVARSMLLDWVESTPTREVRLDATAVSHV